MGIEQLSILSPVFEGNEAVYLQECIRANMVSSIGPFVKDFERKLCSETHFSYAIAVTSGTAALHMALLACHVRENDLVIIPSYTFIATANAVSYYRAKAWIVDVSEQDWNIDLDKLQAVLRQETYYDHNNILRHRVTEQRVVAIDPVFCMGMPVDFDKLTSLARLFGLKVIVDAASGIGASYQGNWCFFKLSPKRECSCYHGNDNKRSSSGLWGVRV